MFRIPIGDSAEPRICPGIGTVEQDELISRIQHDIACVCHRLHIVSRQAPPDATGLGVIGKVLRTSVEESHMKNGKVDIDSLEAIAFDPYTHGYYKIGGRVGNAFQDGLKLK